MVVFALVNSRNSGGYYIASDRTSMGWRELPHDLAHEMEDVRRKGEEVEEVAMGFDGDWFLRTDKRHACKTYEARTSMISNVEQFALLVQQAGLSLAQFAIQFFTFVPDPSGYVTVLHKTDGTLTRCAWHNVPRELDVLLEREAQKGVRHVAVGMNGGYVVVLNSGVVWWSGVPAQLNQLLTEAERTRRRVATVSLSLISDSWYFVEFLDGTTKFFLPPAWHTTINEYTARASQVRRPKITTSFNSARSPSPSPLHYFPQTPQFGSFSPITGSLHASLTPGYTPFASNPHLASAFTGSPHATSTPGYIPFASNPHLASAFTGMPQQPVYNITNIYNNPMPQQHQHQQEQTSSLEDYNGMFKLLGGALKLAGAVLGPDMGLGDVFN